MTIAKLNDFTMFLIVMTWNNAQMPFSDTFALSFKPGSPKGVV